MAEVATSPPTPAHNRTRNWMKPGLQVGRNGKWGQMGEKWGKWRGMGRNEVKWGEMGKGAFCVS